MAIGAPGAVNLDAFAPSLPDDGMDFHDRLTGTLKIPMKPLRCLVVIAGLFFCAHPFAQAQEDFRNLLGSLGYRFGTYHTIEGTRASGSKVSYDTLAVDTVDGKKLEKPVLIEITNIAGSSLPENEQIVLKGYESGKFVGSPSLPREEAEKWGVAQRAFSFQCYFVPTTIVQPEGLNFALTPYYTRYPRARGDAPAKK